MSLGYCIQSLSKVSFLQEHADPIAKINCIHMCFILRSGYTHTHTHRSTEGQIAILLRIHFRELSKTHNHSALMSIIWPIVYFVEKLLHHYLMTLILDCLLFTSIYSKYLMFPGK